MFIAVRVLGGSRIAAPLSHAALSHLQSLSEGERRGVFFHHPQLTSSTSELTKTALFSRAQQGSSRAASELLATSRSYSFSSLVYGGFSVQAGDLPFCHVEECPSSVVQPNYDCSSEDESVFSLHICRLDSVFVDGAMEGSLVRIDASSSLVVGHRASIAASGLGCLPGHGIGHGRDAPAGGSGGGGHGGKGGAGHFNGSRAAGGAAYGRTMPPCSVGSGGGLGPEGRGNSGGGLIVLGPVARLELWGGTLAADGSFLNTPSPTIVAAGATGRAQGVIGRAGGAMGGSGQGRGALGGGEGGVGGRGVGSGGVGGGAGGTVVIHAAYLNMTLGSLISASGGQGHSVGGGGGGGGKVYFAWQNLERTRGDEYTPRATIEGNWTDAIRTSGGQGSYEGEDGEGGLTGSADCPPGLVGLFCQECPVGTFKNESGSDPSLCHKCPLELLPHHAEFVYKRGGASAAPCPYRCLSSHFSLPHCDTPMEGLIRDLGGPWVFALACTLSVLLLGFAITLARTKILLAGDDLAQPQARDPDVATHMDHSLPFLESLNEVMESTRVEEAASHVHRLFFCGDNSFAHPLHLPHSPPRAVRDVVYEDSYNRLVDEVNATACFQWWEGCVHSLLSLLALPFAWSWQQWRRRLVVQRLREFVHTRYDHSCLRSCRSRALYEGLKVSATPDLVLGYMDVFLGGDEMAPHMPPSFAERLPLLLVLGGNGSYMAPYHLFTDDLLTNIVSQAIPPTVWYRLVAGLNAHLRTVTQGNLQGSLKPILRWLCTHVNPSLEAQDVSVSAHLAWLQPTSASILQLALCLDHPESNDYCNDYLPAAAADPAASFSAPSLTSFGSATTPNLVSFGSSFGSSFGNSRFGGFGGSDSWSRVGGRLRPEGSASVLSSPRTAARLPPPRLHHHPLPSAHRTVSPLPSHSRASSDVPSFSRNVSSLSHQHSPQQQQQQRQGQQQQQQQRQLHQQQQRQQWQQSVSPSSLLVNPYLNPYSASSLYTPYSLTATPHYSTTSPSPTPMTLPSQLDALLLLRDASTQPAIATSAGAASRYLPAGGFGGIAEAGSSPSSTITRSRVTGYRGRAGTPSDHEAASGMSTPHPHSPPNPHRWSSLGAEESRRFNFQDPLHQQQQYQQQQRQHERQQWQQIQSGASGRLPPHSLSVKLPPQQQQQQQSRGEQSPSVSSLPPLSPHRFERRPSLTNLASAEAIPGPSGTGNGSASVLLRRNPGSIPENLSLLSDMEKSRGGERREVERQVSSVSAGLLWQSAGGRVGKRQQGGLIDYQVLKRLDEGRGLFLPCCGLLLRNTLPVGHDAAVGLAMSMLLLADLCLFLLCLLQAYSTSLLAFALMLFILPLAPLFSAAAGLNALFAHGARSGAGLGRVYGLWNVTSLANGVVAVTLGVFHVWQSYKGSPSGAPPRESAASEEFTWLLFPGMFVACKLAQARVIDRHVANLEIQDRTLLAEDPTVFWEA
ncbi:hypothetical protein CLOP_g1132 [Closterium sp. NIES-67]|nr:hypothetical protein CLOP_g1132 [Closterium sp. NIES-67]